MGSRNMYSGLVLVTLLGLLGTSEAAPDHGDHAAHNNELDSGLYYINHPQPLMILSEQRFDYSFSFNLYFTKKGKI